METEYRTLKAYIADWCAFIGVIIQYCYISLEVIGYSLKYICNQYVVSRNDGQE